jgi:hypothetical protein
MIGTELRLGGFLGAMGIAYKKHDYWSASETDDLIDNRSPKQTSNNSTSCAYTIAYCTTTVSSMPGWTVQ